MSAMNTLADATSSKTWVQMNAELDRIRKWHAKAIISEAEATALILRAVATAVEKHTIGQAVN